jgi:hypothetical protein
MLPFDLAESVTWHPKSSSKDHPSLPYKLLSVFPSKKRQELSAMSRVPLKSMASVWFAISFPTPTVTRKRRSNY